MDKLHKKILFYSVLFVVIVSNLSLLLIIVKHYAKERPFEEISFILKIFGVEMVACTVMAWKSFIDNDISIREPDGKKSGVVVHVRTINFLLSSTDVRNSIEEYFMGIFKESSEKEYGQIDCLGINGGELTAFFPTIQSIDCPLRWAINLYSIISNRKDWNCQFVISMGYEQGGRRCSAHPKCQCKSVHLLGRDIDITRRIAFVYNLPGIILSASLYNIDALIGKHDDFVVKINDSVSDIYKTDVLSLSTSVKKINITDNRNTYSVTRVQVETKDKIIIIGSEHTAPSYNVEVEMRNAEDSFERNNFIERLSSADRVVIIGITNQNLIDFLTAALEKRKGSLWKELTIIFAGYKSLDLIIDDHEGDLAIALKNRREKWKNSVFELHKFLSCQYNGNNYQWDCRQFIGELTFVGQKYSPAKGTSSVRIAPILPGCNTTDTYYMEFFEGSDLYLKINNSYDVVINKSDPIMAWNVFLNYMNNSLTLGGLIEQKHWRTLTSTRENKKVLPVVVNILHFTSGGREKIVLQLRNIYNSSGELGKYSLFSEIVKDEDFFEILNIHPNDEYYNKYIEAHDEGNGCQKDSSKENISNIFADLIKVPINSEIESDMWSQVKYKTALRGVETELGIPIQATSLCEVGNARDIIVNKEGFTLLFSLFTVKITSEYYQNTKKTRPNLGLKCIDSKDQLIELNRLGRLNTFLTKRFDDIISQVLEKINFN